MKDSKNKKTGFTLVELTMAMAFISILFIAIGMTTSGIISAYKKGVAIKSVDTLAQSLIEEFTTSVQDAPTINFETLCAKHFSPTNTDTSANYQACVSENAYHLIYQQWFEEVSTNGADAEPVPVFGAFCTGKYSYVWNTGYTFNGNNSIHTTKNGASEDIDPSAIRLGDTDDIQPRLLRFSDPSFSVCATPFRQSPDRSYNDVLNSSAASIASLYSANLTDGEELIAYSSNPIAIYDFTTFKPAQDNHTKRLFYSSSMILATIAGGVNIMSTGNYCAPPSDLELQSDFSYCAVNKFNFTMRASGE